MSFSYVNLKNWGYLLWRGKYYHIGLIIHEKILIFLPRIEIRGYFRKVPTRCDNLLRQCASVASRNFSVNNPRDLSLGCNFQFICYFIILN